MKGKIAIVTGGASGIGEAVVEQLISKGVLVVAADRDIGKLAELEQRIESKHLSIVETDIANEESVLDLFRSTLSRLGQIDFLVNSAGIGVSFVPFEETKTLEFDQASAINLRGTFLTTRSAIVAMKETGGGSIVNISSTAGIRPLRLVNAYTPSKWGVVGLTLSAALEVAADNIRVNVVCPGIVDTPMLRNSSEVSGDDFAKITPMRRMGSAGDMANAVCWLLSDEASFVTGLIMPVDGGLSLT